MGIHAHAILIPAMTREEALKQYDEGVEAMVRSVHTASEDDSPTIDQVYRAAVETAFVQYAEATTEVERLAALALVAHEHAALLAGAVMEKLEAERK